MSGKSNIAFIGAGNVASHLAPALVAAGHNITAVAARSKDSASALAQKVGAAALDNYKNFPDVTDTIIIATNDESIKEIASTLHSFKALVLHTSGSVPLSVLSERHPHSAVLYPLQTFSKESHVDLSNVPFFIEGNDADAFAGAEALARTLSKNVFHADSDTRAALHIAGVLTSNFPIYLLEIARKVIARHNLPLDILKPLAEASFAKAFEMNPAEALTGPARRGDIATVKKHCTALTDNSDRKIYETISQAILNKFHPEKSQL